MKTPPGSDCGRVQAVATRSASIANGHGTSARDHDMTLHSTYLSIRRHGPVATCPISATAALLKEYIELPDDSPERTRMERRFGRSTLRKLVKEYEEELAFQEWLRHSTGTPCPSCDLRVEKHSGCNHVRTGGLCSLDESGAEDRFVVPADDVPPMQTTLLLPVRGEAGPVAAVQAFLDAWVAMLREAVRRGEHRDGVAASRGLRRAVLDSTSVANASAACCVCCERRASDRGRDKI